MLYLRQIVEVKKLTKLFSQFSLGDYSVGQEFQALLFHLGKETNHEPMPSCIQSYDHKMDIGKIFAKK